MKKFSSKNYDFHFLRDSIAERDIQEIAELFMSSENGTSVAV